VEEKEAMKRSKVLAAAGLVLAAASLSLAQVGRGRDVPVRLLPDLTTVLISAKGNKAVVRVLNVCKGDAPASRVKLTVSSGADKKSASGSVIEEDVPPLSGTASMNLGKRSVDLVITLDASSAVKSFDGKFIRLMVDPLDKIREASEGNNWYEKGVGAAQPFPDAGGYCDAPAAKMASPSFNITGKQKVANSTTYKLSVSNWKAFPVSWFTPDVSLPPNPCDGGGHARARMLAHFVVVKSDNGTAYKAGCKPLDSPSNLTALEFTAAGVLSDLDQVKITLEDRATGAKSSSEPFLVGWYDWANALVPLGCKNFLGRNGNYLCTTDDGFSACENLRRQGKPLRCTRAGKAQ
jgi:hypothetical protein